ncbi:DUF1389 domain-containing protein [Chlamydia crocodili]|uniref:DUF1389 domain-containing protein n=1 Tax=Chlamydia crocodili TaxID=2766982 RepID=A0ABX8CFD2_9CHLA|nr:DUF1389 domain-containing protein [Chlamydia crocodili]QVE49154.1 DUF1389 domain-containing protein [Chlamydia crocodili]
MTLNNIFPHIQSPSCLPLMNLGKKTRGVLDTLCKHAITITGIFCLICAVSLLSVVIYGFAHPLLVTGVALSLVIVGIVSALALRYAMRELKHPLPSGFRSLIKETYPQIIYDLVFTKALTFREFRAVVSGLSSGNFHFPSEDCKNRVESFGFERLQKACEGVMLPNLEKILLKNCPLYLINKFIHLGPIEFPEAEHMEPTVYWVNRVGLSDINQTAFHPFVWLLARLTSEEEYNILCQHARDNTWRDVRSLVEALYTRFRMYLENENVKGFERRESWLLEDLNGSRAPWLLALCKHGITWEQLQLFKDIECCQLSFLHTFDTSRVGGILMELLLVVSQYINEENIKDFDPHITLLTLKEWMHFYRHDSHRLYGFHKGVLEFFNKHSKHNLQKPKLSSFHLHYYLMDPNTGVRYR